MGTTVASRSMPRRKDEEKRTDVPVRIDTEVVKDARLVAAYRDVSLAQYISDLIRPLVARDVDELQKELAKNPRVQPARSKKGGGPERA
jgi:hypothetical protein